MRQQTVTLSAAGSSKWLLVDPRRFQDFNANLAVTLDNTANLTYDVELTLDANSNQRWQKATIARTGTTATVTLADHGLKTGDNIQVFDTNYTNHNPEPNLEGSFDITVTGDDTFTYTVVDTGQTSAIGRIISFSVFDHASLAGETTEQSGVQNDPVSGIRLNITAYTAGSATLTVLQQG